MQETTSIYPNKLYAKIQNGKISFYVDLPDHPFVQICIWQVVISWMDEMTTNGFFATQK